MMAVVTERPTPIEPGIHAEAQRLLAEIERTGIAARLIGGMAIRLLAADRLPAAFERPIQDLDVLVESFSMCHELPLAERIPVRPHSHTVSAGREGDGSGAGEGDIDVERIVALTSNDWGLQHTSELNLSRLRGALPEQPLDAAEAASVAERIDVLVQALERAPKTRKWKLRAKVGERKRWYEEPEEVDR